MIRTICFLFVVAASFVAKAEDWPTYQHDNRRSGVTTEEVEFPLNQLWRYKSPTPPQTAWTSPAKWDAYSGNAGLQSMRNFDPAFYVTVVGQSVYFGSSVDNAAHCLDAETGEQRWKHFTNSAVRLPPTIDGDRALFGSDDGHIYCVDAATGERKWKFRPAPDPRLIPSNGKLISLWPVRTGVLVNGGLAYFAASLLPWETSYLCAVDAVTGFADGSGGFIREEKSVTLQGALLSSSNSLYAPQGRSEPIVFEREGGKRVGGISGTGGVYCVLTEDDQFIAMPANQKEAEDTIRIAGRDRQVIVSFSGANRMIVSGRHAFFHQGTKLKAVDRKKLLEVQEQINELQAANGKRAAAKKKAKGDAEKIAQLDAEMAAAGGQIAALEARKPESELWSKEEMIPMGFMLAGKTLFVGGDKVVTAYETESGKRLWSIEVDGKAYGLAAANGQVYVSTDLGSIYCFRKG